MFTNFLIYIGFVDKLAYEWSGNKSRLKLHLLRSSGGGWGKMMHKRLQLVSGSDSRITVQSSLPDKRGISQSDQRASLPVVSNYTLQHLMWMKDR